MLLMATMGITVLVVIHPDFLSGNLQAVLFGILYFVLTAGLVFVWLTLPHQVMREACNQTLKPLADEFQQAIAETRALSQQDANATKAGTDRLANLKRLMVFISNTLGRL